jgi:hypothetical protein
VGDGRFIGSAPREKNIGKGVSETIFADLIREIADPQFLGEGIGALKDVRLSGI